MQKLFVFLLVILLFAKCNESNNERAELAEIVENISQKCPQMIDSETRLDGVNFKLPDTLTYNYTLVNLSVQNVDTVEFRRALMPGLMSTIRVSGEMKKLRDNNIVICYNYKDKNSQPIYIFKITPNDYNKN